MSLSLFQKGQDKLRPFSISLQNLWHVCSESLCVSLHLSEQIEGVNVKSLMRQIVYEICAYEPSETIADENGFRRSYIIYR